MRLAQGAENATDELFAGIDALDATGGRQFEVCLLSPREPLFRKGDSGGMYYQVLKGVVSSYRLLHNGRRQVLSFGFPGDLVGIGHEYGCRCDCEAVSAAKLRCIPAGSLRRLLHARPDLAHRMLAAARSELAGIYGHFVIAGRKSAMEKLASFLLTLARRHGNGDGTSTTVGLPMSRSDIADFLGLTTETVSRQFTALRKLGVIDLPRTTMVHVRDMLRLEELAESTGATW